MLRPLVLGLSFALGSVLGWAPAPEQPKPDPPPCCKVCRKGKACGDSCIARDKDCTEAPGCACDAET